MAATNLTIGNQIIEGKTKIVYDLPEQKGNALILSKDRITAGDGVRSNDMAGKAAISTSTAVKIFELLNSSGIKTHFVKRHSDTAFIAKKCAMIPIEFVTRRIATGSFLRRHTGVKEGFRFNPPKLEYFFKDDENHDPQWSSEQIICAKFKFNGVEIGKDELAILSVSTVTIFEILENAWKSLDCSLIDMKIEFGVTEEGELVLADLIDSDSWRLWPSGDKRLMKDKQVYRDLRDVTPEALNEVKRNFEWVANKVEQLTPKPNARVVIFMGSPSDLGHCQEIKKSLSSFGVPCELRVSSAHKATCPTLDILGEIEGEGIPTVFIAVAGRSNGLGPVLSGNATWPVINCPPIKPDWGQEDIWSSLRLPSGLACTTIIGAESAAIHAAQILSLHDHMIWAKLRARKLHNIVSLNVADRKIRDD
ncbi:DgyrCDS10404 [Dimorphilus gyrociliatus]|uniref:DgyrCDS10404 n=1 Tax=Dimorphilus gyrociliatus TaxID=2664684 RepID=A0A7I8W2N5_9ANNE|nr:DgyrCDS10404 [Dimorphilus gyrociliatus]